MTSLWPFLTVALLVVAGFPLAFRWRARHTRHATVRRRWVATDGPRCIGHTDTWRDAVQLARADAEGQP
jgi:hypothetical protein